MWWPSGGRQKPPPQPRIPSRHRRCPGKQVSNQTLIIKQCQQHASTCCCTVLAVMCRASCFLAAAKADEPAASARELSGSGAKAEARVKAADTKKAAEPKAGREVDRPASRWAATVSIVF
jgi:hypothetical protein